MKQNLDELFGLSGRGDYRPGDTIAFVEDGKPLTGEVIHCSAPQKTVTGRQLPTTYEVDCGDGWPHVVLSSQIVEWSGERVEERMENTTDLSLVKRQIMKYVTTHKDTPLTGMKIRKGLGFIVDDETWCQAFIELMQEKQTIDWNMLTLEE